MREERKKFKGGGKTREKNKVKKEESVHRHRRVRVTLLTDILTPDSVQDLRVAKNDGTSGLSW